MCPKNAGKLGWSINEVGLGEGLGRILCEVRSGNASEHRLFTGVAAVKHLDQFGIPVSIEAMMTIKL